MNHPNPLLSFLPGSLPCSPPRMALRPGLPHSWGNKNTRCLLLCDIFNLFKEPRVAPWFSLTPIFFLTTVLGEEVGWAERWGLICSHPASIMAAQKFELRSPMSKSSILNSLAMSNIDWCVRTEGTRRGRCCVGLGGKRKEDGKPGCLSSGLGGD